MGRTHVVDVGDGRTWLIDIRSRERSADKPSSSLQIVVPVEELEGANPDEVGRALMALTRKAREFYIEHWADVYSSVFGTTFRQATSTAREMMLTLLAEAEGWGVENEHVARLRETLRLGSLTWLERFREMEVEQMQTPRIQRLIERVAERQGRFCLLCQATEVLTVDHRPAKEWPKKRSRKRRKGESEDDVEEDPDYYLLICLDCFMARLEAADTKSP
jgi:hypothetical protein